MSNARSRRLLHRCFTPTLAMVIAAQLMGCEPAEDEPMHDDMSLDSDGEHQAELEAPAQRPETAEQAGKHHAGPQQLTAASGPVAAPQWLPAVSEETPPATCNSDQVAIGSDCMGWHCDLVQLKCGDHSGTAGARSWSSWFSEEAPDSWHICPGTQWVTGVACDGPWCDNLSLECTDLGISASSCSWSRRFSSSDPEFNVPTGHLIAGIQCLGPYCEELSYFHCAT